MNKGSAPTDGRHHDGAKTSFGWRKCCVKRSCWTKHSKLDFFDRLFECPCKLNNIQNEPKSCDIEIHDKTEHVGDLIMVSSEAMDDEDSVHRRVIRAAINENKSRGTWFQR
uniref:Uncharacterized protein n=1 Tax=Romanomermis culicivorax TaxID=13658 RepID=A0A915KKK9_ROMCU